MYAHACKKDFLVDALALICFSPFDSKNEFCLLCQFFTKLYTLRVASLCEIGLFKKVLWNKYWVCTILTHIMNANSKMIFLGLMQILACVPVLTVCIIHTHCYSPNHPVWRHVEGSLYYWHTKWVLVCGKRKNFYFLPVVHSL